ncbi:hypothetical protein MRX96_011045 [Rhipicephalus microplus]
MNGYNLVSRFFGFRNELRQHKIAAYIPDVTDLSSWVNSSRTSDEITMGLASVSLIFDVLLLAWSSKGNDLSCVCVKVALTERVESSATIQLAGLWGSIDCVVDAVIGFLSANYTLPAFEIEERIETERRRTELAIRNVPPATIRQFLHFAWVIMRLVIKSLILCSLFEYAEFLSRRDQMPKMLIVEPGQGSFVVRESVNTY